MARPMGGRVPEKSKDFKGSMKRLFVNLENWRYLFIFALILAMTSAILSLNAPNKLSDFTDVITKGLQPNINENTFNDIMNDYWNSVISEEDRLFFYPLYLWWQITGVIPMRPREYILTPRNCMEQKEDGWYITLRKNQIKGPGKRISYKIDSDYITVQYKIPDKLAGEILKYLDFTISEPRQI